jgi:hypothetical protein
MRVLHFHDSGGWQEHVPSRIARRSELLGGEHTIHANFRQLNTGIRTRSSGLVPYRMRFTADDDVIAGSCQRTQGDLIRHRPRRQPQRGFLAEELCDAFLQSVDRRILAELVVANGRRRNRLAHRWRGTRDRV